MFLVWMTTLSGQDLNFATRLFTTREMAEKYITLNQSNFDGNFKIKELRKDQIDKIDTWLFQGSDYLYGDENICDECDKNPCECEPCVYCGESWPPNILGEHQHECEIESEIIEEEGDFRLCEFCRDAYTLDEIGEHEQQCEELFAKKSHHQLTEEEIKDIYKRATEFAKTIKGEK